MNYEQIITIKTNRRCEASHYDDPRLDSGFLLRTCITVLVLLFRCRALSENTSSHLFRVLKDDLLPVKKDRKPKPVIYVRQIIGHDDLNVYNVFLGRIQN